MYCPSASWKVVAANCWNVGTSPSTGAALALVAARPAATVAARATDRVRSFVSCMDGAPQGVRVTGSAGDCSKP
jgi:hypothetical protein